MLCRGLHKQPANASEDRYKGQNRTSATQASNKQQQTALTRCTQTCNTMPRTRHGWQTTPGSCNQAVATSKKVTYDRDTFTATCARRVGLHLPVHALCPTQTIAGLIVGAIKSNTPKHHNKSCVGRGGQHAKSPNIQPVQTEYSSNGCQPLVRALQCGTTLQTQARKHTSSSMPQLRPQTGERVGNHTQKTQNHFHSLVVPEMGGTAAMAAPPPCSRKKTAN